MSDATIGSSKQALAAVRSPVFWLALVALGLVGLVYAPLLFPPSHTAVAVQSEEFFFEPNEAAGAPVLVLALWLLYRRSHYRDLLLGPGALVPGLLVLALTLTLYSWGAYTGAPDLQLASVMGLLAGGVLLLGGFAALRAYWLPIVFLAFALPVSPVLLGAVLFPIQLATAAYSGAILNAIGVDCLVQGDQILRPENTFIVIETCSGVRTVVTLAMLTILLIDLYERRGLHAALLMLLSPIVAFLTNGVRVVTLVLNPHSSIHSIHNLQGIAMLLVGLTIMYGLDVLLERLLGSKEPSVEDGDYGVARASSDSPARQALRLVIVVGALVAMLVAGRTMPKWTYDRGLAEMPDGLLTRVFGEETSRSVDTDYQFRGSVRYLAHARRRVALGAGVVDVHLGVADEQERRHTHVSPRLAWPDSGYAVVEDGEVSLGPDGPIVRRTVLRRGVRTLVSWSWYVRDRGVLRETFRHALALDRSPFVRPRHVLAIRLTTAVGRRGADLEAAEALLRAAWARLAPELEGYAPTQLAAAEAPASR
ncbi:MAG TPA: exosortase/archaeosortase family protein [Myxococcota bacterium]|nr:exosortase/archaeosortase family protein [Myxococcota bacterium]